MVLGGAGMAVACAVGVHTVRRWRAVKWTGAVALVWLAVAAALVVF